MNQGLENTKDTMLIYCCPARDIGEGKREEGKRSMFSRIQPCEEVNKLVVGRAFLVESKQVAWE